MRTAQIVFFFDKDVTGKYCTICYLDIQLLRQEKADAVNDL